MASKPIKRIWFLASAFLVIFLAALAIRYDMHRLWFSEDHIVDTNVLAGMPDKKSWMNIYLNNNKIGYAYSELSKNEAGHQLNETMFMRMNIMGFTQDLAMETSAALNPDLTIDSFNFKLNSGIFEFAATGRMKGKNLLAIETDMGGMLQQIDIPLEQPPYLTSALLYSVSRRTDLTIGDQFAFEIFDPSTMSREKVLIHVAGYDELTHMGRRIHTTKLIINYKGATETAWMDESGDIIREEGILGMTLEKTTRQDAYAGIPDRPEEDIVRLASVPADKVIKKPRDTVYLKIQISGIDYGSLSLEGGRQKRDGDILEITQEKFQHQNMLNLEILSVEARKYLNPEPFIESDHPEIKRVVDTIVSREDRPYLKARKMVRWMHKNIEKKPVLSIPDALTTLKNRVGDCNEHAILLAALARASGIPSKVEAGLVYLDDRFYYHAWNLLYVGQWVTADSTFGQFPADATHIRLVSGSPKNQMDLMSVIDKVRISILADEAYIKKGKPR